MSNRIKTAVLTFIISTAFFWLGFRIGGRYNSHDFIQPGAIGPVVYDTVVVRDTIKIADDKSKHYWYWYKSVTFPGHGGTFEGYGLLKKGDTVVDPKGEVMAVSSEGRLLKN